MTIFNLLYILVAVFFVVFGIIFLILIFNGDKIQQKRCERFREEMRKKGMDEEFIEHELLSNDFML